MVQVDYSIFFKCVETILVILLKPISRSLLLMAQSLHQSRLAVYPIIYSDRVLYIPGGADFFHQQYAPILDLIHGLWLNVAVAVAVAQS